MLRQLQILPHPLTQSHHARGRENAVRLRCSLHDDEEYNAKIGPQILAARDLRSLAGNRAYGGKPFRDDLQTDRIRPLIPHRIYSSLDKAHNARINCHWYNRRWTCRNVFSVIKRRSAPPCVREAGASNSKRWYSSVPSTIFVERPGIRRTARNSSVSPPWSSG